MERIVPPLSVLRSQGIATCKASEATRTVIRTEATFCRVSHFAVGLVRCCYRLVLWVSCESHDCRCWYEMKRVTSPSRQQLDLERLGLLYICPSSLWIVLCLSTVSEWLLRPAPHVMLCRSLPAHALFYVPSSALLCISLRCSMLSLCLCLKSRFQYALLASGLLTRGACH